MSVKSISFLVKSSANLNYATWYWLAYIAWLNAMQEIV